MPHVSVKLYPGRSEEVKRHLSEAIMKDLIEIAKCAPESVSISMEEVPPAEWGEKVYRPDILDKWETLYQKPGYDPPK